MEESPLGRFGLLPPEIRNEIYRLVLCECRGDIWITHRNTENKAGKTHTTSRTRALTQVSRAVRRETLGLYFSLNTFTVRTEFNNKNRLLNWVENVVTPRYFPCLREVVIWHTLWQPSLWSEIYIPKRHVARLLRPHEEIATLFYNDRQGRLSLNTFQRPYNPMLFVDHDRAAALWNEAIAIGITSRHEQLNKRAFRKELTRWSQKTIQLYCQPRYFTNFIDSWK